MDWQRKKFSRWTSGDFSITEVESIDRPYQLDVLDESPVAYPTLREAQQVARLKHELNLTRLENVRLRAEMDARNGHAGSALTLVEATRQPANAPRSDDRLPLPEDFGLQSDGSPWPDEEHGDGRGIPKSSFGDVDDVADVADVDAIAGRLLAVMARNGQTR